MIRNFRKKIYSAFMMLMLAACAAVLFAPAEAKAREFMPYSGGPLKIIKQPPSELYIFDGEQATLTVEATGGGEPLFYVWTMKNGTDGEWTVQESDSPSYTYTANVDEDGCTLYCQVLSGSEYIWTDGTTLNIEANAPIAIVKDPTDETVEEGGSALFIAGSEGGVSCEWYWHTDGDASKFSVETLADKYPGVKYQLKGGMGEQLLLTDIPLSLDGVSFFCRFAGPPNPEADTKSAVLRVKVKAPKITKQPANADAIIGTETTLGAAADGGSNQLEYQWYSGSTNDRGGMSRIDGANAADYTVPQTEGDVYYCLGVRAKSGDKTSDEVFTDVVRVTYSAATPMPTATPEAAHTGMPDFTYVPTDSPAELPTPALTSAPEQHGGPSAAFWIIIGAAAFTVVGGAAAVIIIGRKKK